MAIRTNFELLDIIETSNNFGINATDKEGVTQILITSENALQYMRHKYGTRQYSVLRGMEAPTKAEAFSDFTFDFTSWLRNRQHNIDLQYQALFDYDFSPIENVDRYETETIERDDTTTYGKTNTISETDSTTYGKTDTTTYGKTDTISATTENDSDGTDSVIKSGSEATETTKAGFNSPNSYTPDTKNQTTYNNVTDATRYGKTETETVHSTDTLSGSDTIRTTGTDTLTKSESDRLGGADNLDSDTERTLRVHGNIGITSNATLIKETLELRSISLAEMLIDNFINDYTFYA